MDRTEKLTIARTLIKHGEEFRPIIKMLGAKKASVEFTVDEADVWVRVFDHDRMEHVFEVCLSVKSAEGEVDNG